MSTLSVLLILQCCWSTANSSYLSISFKSFKCHAVTVLLIVIYHLSCPSEDLLQKLDILLSLFPATSCHSSKRPYHPLWVVLPSSSSAFCLPFLTFNICPQTQARKCPVPGSPATNINSTLLYVFDHMLSLTITLPILPTITIKTCNLYLVSLSCIVSFTLSFLLTHYQPYLHY